MQTEDGNTEMATQMANRDSKTEMATQDGNTHMASETCAHVSATAKYNLGKQEMHGSLADHAGRI